MVYFAGDDLLAALRPRGLPIGNLTSQFWANCYLNPFDHFVKRELGCRGYVRYVDDLLLFADERACLREWRAQIIAQLARLRLTLHERSAVLRPVADGISFLGFILFPTHRRLKSRKGHAFRARLALLAQAVSTGQLEQEKLDAVIRGWVSHVQYADTWGLRRAVLGLASTFLRPLS